MKISFALFRSLIERWLLLWLCLGSVMAFYWPRISITVDPFLAGTSSLPYILAIIMFSLGCLLPPEEVKKVWFHWPTVVGGTALQYSVMPIFAITFAVLFPVSEETFVGLLMVGCVPGAMASNVLTLKAGGNVSYSVSLTTVATILSPLVVPTILYLLLQNQEDIISPNPLGMCQTLLLTVVIPVISGFVLCRFWKRFAKVMALIGSLLANLLILWVIWVVVANNRDRLSQSTLGLIGILLAINLLGFFAGYFGGWGMGLDERRRRALTIEIGMQNAGLGAILALQFFGDRPATAIPPAVYMFGCMLTGTVLASWWAANPSSDRANESRDNNRA